MKRSLTAGAVALALMLALALPASALFRSKKEAPMVADVTKNGLVGSMIPFEEGDFVVQGGGRITLKAVVVESLPDAGAGTLLLGGTVLEQGSRVEKSALSGLRFQSLGAGTVQETAFRLIPVFSDGSQGAAFTVSIVLLTKENHPPVARDLELSTFKNVSVTGYFDAVDAEGDVLTFKLISNPARGAVELAEDGSGSFVYRPYENKTGKDRFTYVAVDGAGNQSGKGTVLVRIEKADTPVTYQGLDGHPAHKSAVALAEAGVYVGPCVGGAYCFDPDRPVNRSEFLAMAMKVARVEPLERISVTGFADDAAIPAWSKGYVSAALSAGAVRGGLDENGAAVFRGDEAITAAQAAVMLDRLLGVSDVPVEVFAGQSREHWAGQAAANLAACGILREEGLSEQALSQTLTLGEAAVMLDGALKLREVK